MTFLLDHFRLPLGRLFAEGFCWQSQGLQADEISMIMNQFPFFWKKSGQCFYLRFFFREKSAAMILAIGKIPLYRSWGSQGFCLSTPDLNTSSLLITQQSCVEFVFLIIVICMAGYGWFYVIYVITSLLARSESESMGPKKDGCGSQKNPVWVLVSIIFLFSPRKLGKMIQFNQHSFQMSWFKHHPAVGYNDCFFSSKSWRF